MRNLKNIATLALAAAILLPTGAFAAAGVATSAVNVRTGPGTGYAIVDTLFAGESVEIGECQSGWCYVDQDGPDGWVSASYLQPAGGSGSGTTGTDDDCHIHWVVGRGFTLECNGSSITVPGVGGFPGGGPFPTKKVCVYDGPNYTGAHVCANAGISDSHINAPWNNKISSLKVFGGAKIQLCQNYNFMGFCNTFSNNVPMLGIPLNNKASSYKTW